MIVRNDISKVREDIEGLIGQHVVIRCNKGKRRTTINKGVLERCPFVLYVGTRKLVKRKEFEEYISGKLII